MSEITLAYIRWLDSSITSGDALTLDQVSGILENESCGIVIREDDTSITIALDRCLATECVRCTMCIPKNSIQVIRKIRTTPEDNIVISTTAVN